MFYTVAGRLRERVEPGGTTDDDGPATRFAPEIHVPTDTRSIYLATNCYGGQASATYMQSLLALRPACAARRIGLHIDLGGGEALIGRARAAMMAKFLASDATHLLFIDSDAAFDVEAVFQQLAAGHDVSEITEGLLISRSAAQRMKDVHPHLHARLDDMHALGIDSAAMVFDPMVDPATGAYLADLDAFRVRWRALLPQVPPA